MEQEIEMRQELIRTLEFDDLPPTASPSNDDSLLTGILTAHIQVKWSISSVMNYHVHWKGFDQDEPFWKVTPMNFIV